MAVIANVIIISVAILAAMFTFPGGTGESHQETSRDFALKFEDTAAYKKVRGDLPPLGKPMREEFLMDPEFLALNHGSYGSYPKYVQKALHAVQAKAEYNIDHWLRVGVIEELKKVRFLLAAYLNAGDPDDIVVIPNATGGMNAILRSMIFEAGDKILHFNTVFNSLRSLIKYIIDINNGNVSQLEFNVAYPMTNAELLGNFSAFLDSQYQSLGPNSRIRIAIIDHITSEPGVVNPIHEIIPLLKAKNILVLIDGAHAIGQIPIDLKSLDPDFYITNCHKWLFAVRGAAVMYVKKDHQRWIHPPHITDRYSIPSDFQEEFFWTGTKDFSSYLTIPAALEFRNMVGEERLLNYNHRLAVEGGALMAAMLGTRVLQTEEQIGSMVDVQLPLDDPTDPQVTDLKFWRSTWLNRFHMYVVTYIHNGQIWIRVSAQIYTDLTDFKRAAEACKLVTDELNQKLLFRWDNASH